MRYSAVCEEMHGPDFEWEQQPIDGVAAYKAGHGKKHGRYLFGDGMISTPAVLSAVRVSDTVVEHQPLQRRRPNPEDEQAIEQKMHAEMERRLQQQREEMEKKMEQEREEMERKRQRDREAWEAEMQPERDYYKNSLLAITQHLKIDLPPPP